MRQAVVTLTLILVLLATSFLITERPVSGAEATENTWTTKAPMQVARANFGIAVVDGKVYTFGGDDGSPMGNVIPAHIRTAETVNTTEEYDPTLDAWTFKKPMPTARALLGVAVYQNKVYCIGGYYGKYVYNNDVLEETEYFNTGVNEVYDPATDAWVTRAAMPTFDHFATANVVNGRIYVIGSNTTQAYNPATDSWTTKAPPLCEINSPGVSAVVDNKIYFIGTGTSADGVWKGAFIQAYNPANDNWTIIDEAPTYMLSGTAGATTGAKAPKRIYFFDETGTNVYDLASHTWTVGASKLSARYLARVSVVSDVFYVVGGRSGQVGYITMLRPSAVNEQYIPFGYGTIPPEPEPEPFPTVPVAAVSAVSIAAVIAGLVFSRRRRQKEAKQT